MRVVDLSNVAWRKSSYSNATGGECVEMSVDLLSAAVWRKSSYSNTDGGACVEFSGDLPGVVPVRDSKDVSRTPLVFGAGAWSVFAGAVKRGDLFG
ncbi:DUF397 domain-containing protein [Streptomyces griseoviridis]|uniref:DUF397 domain-containing protein n=1 Tax=Streptomyces sp. MAA16 TaxID=3035116 RepID=UPI0024759D47|nr:DUF397 domain-containing protein [Streptomyces sp. MAA16]MDH6700181.1 hypothetical protein [Streptomyces sp. MAA16]